MRRQAVAVVSGGLKYRFVCMYTVCALPASGHGVFVLMCSDKQLRHAEGPPYICRILRQRRSHRAIVTNTAALDDGAMTHVGL